MTVYLLHQDFNGNPIGVWDENEQSYYPQDNALKKSAETLMTTRYDNEPWEEFSDRIASRISHRDWWDSIESDAANLQDVWIQIEPSAAPLDL